MSLAHCKFVVKFALFLLFVGFCTSAIVLSGYGWHDQQRISQILLIVFAAPLAAFLFGRVLPRSALALLLALFALGLCSAALAAWPEWALKEWARYLGLALLVLLIGTLAQRQPRVLDGVLWAMAFVGCIHAFQFLVYYITAFATGIRMLDADILFNGFSNPRFFGQFQVMLLPVLAWLALQGWRQQRRKTACILLMALTTQWCIAFTLGGRGLWLGLLVSHGALVLINRHHWRIAALQVCAALSGLLLFLLLFQVIPFWLELNAILRDSLRTGLSGREQIWQWAWDMALANPWLGAGPMHYAAVYNPIAAHPHQVILQWLAEWGFPATAMALMLGVWGLSHGAVFLRRATANELDAGLWLAIVGALVLAQVDGVSVMPYTETWLAILIGLAIARWSKPAPAKTYQRIACGLLAIPVVLVLGAVLIQEVPTLPACERAYLKQYGADWAPRFWQQGWISRSGCS